jgi:nitrile hydratase accessory protein
MRATKCTWTCGRAILNPPDAAPVAPFQSDDGPVFDEPWHAQVLALADTMVQSGHFSASDWATTLGAALRDAADNGAPDTAQTYYDCAVLALETLVARRTAIKADALRQRKTAWESAYRATPHGQPVTLASGDAD